MNRLGQTPALARQPMSRPMAMPTACLIALIYPITAPAFEAKVWKPWADYQYVIDSQHHALEVGSGLLYSHYKTGFLHAAPRVRWDDLLIQQNELSNRSQGLSQKLRELDQKRQVFKDGSVDSIQRVSKESLALLSDQVRTYRASLSKATYEAYNQRFQASLIDAIVEEVAKQSAESLRIGIRECKEGPHWQLPGAVSSTPLRPLADFFPDLGAMPDEFKSESAAYLFQGLWEARKVVASMTAVAKAYQTVCAPLLAELEQTLAEIDTGNNLALKRRMTGLSARVGREYSTVMAAIALKKDSKSHQAAVDLAFKPLSLERTQSLFLLQIVTTVVEAREIANKLPTLSLADFQAQWQRAFERLRVGYGILEDAQLRSWYGPAAIANLLEDLHGNKIAIELEFEWQRILQELIASLLENNDVSSVAPVLERIELWQFWLKGLEDHYPKNRGLAELRKASEIVLEAANPFLAPLRETR